MSSRDNRRLPRRTPTLFGVPVAVIEAGDKVLAMNREAVQAFVAGEPIPSGAVIAILVLPDAADTRGAGQ